MEILYLWEEIDDRSADKRKDNWSVTAAPLFMLPDLDNHITHTDTIVILSSAPVQYEQKSIPLFYRSNGISGFSKLSSSSTYTVRVKAFPLVPLGISFRSHKAKLITELACQKVGGYIKLDNRLLKKNRLKYKMSRCCFNTLLPSELAWSPKHEVHPSLSFCRQCCRCDIHHSSSLHPSLHTLDLFFLCLLLSEHCIFLALPHI